MIAFLCPPDETVLVHASPLCGPATRPGSTGYGAAVGASVPVVRRYP
jgi:hypothetical protein